MTAFKARGGRRRPAGSARPVPARLWPEHEGPTRGRAQGLCRRGHRQHLAGRSRLLTGVSYPDTSKMPRPGSAVAGGR